LNCQFIPLSEMVLCSKIQVQLALDVVHCTPPSHTHTHTHTSTHAHTQRTYVRTYVHVHTYKQCPIVKQ